MTRRYAKWLGALAFGFLPLAVFGEPGKVLPPPMMAATGGQLVAPVAAPFGYYATQWRAFPVATASISTAAVAQSSASMIQAPKTANRVVADIAPPLAVSREIVARRMDEPVPPPRPISRPLAAPESTKPVTSIATGGFATLRTTPEIPASLPVVRKPIVDTAVRTASFQDEVLRPAWPVISDVPVKK